MDTLMTPDEIRRVAAAVGSILAPQLSDTNKKVDKLIDEMGKMGIQLATLSAQQEAHEGTHRTWAETRELTCPSIDQTRQNSIDITALAGIQRDHDSRLNRLEDEIEVDEREDLVAAERLRPVKWLARNFDKIIWALLLAALVSYFVER